MSRAQTLSLRLFSLLSLPHPQPLAAVNTAGVDTAVSLYDPGDRVGFRGRPLLRDPGCTGRVCGVSPHLELAGATWLGQ